MIIRLSDGCEAIIDDEDEDRVIGINYKWQCHHDTKPSGRVNKYAFTRIPHPDKPGKQFRLSMHRFILNITDPKIQVDHVNHDTLDNRKYNLRAGPQSMNQQNTRRKLNNKSGYKGVNVSSGNRRKKFQAEIRVNGKATFLGRFEKADDAARAYDEAARLHFGANAHTNF